MDNLRFNEKDKELVIDFLNIIAENAEFTFKTKELIKYFKLLSGMQQVILPKLEANILEPKKVINNIPPLPENN